MKKLIILIIIIFVIASSSTLAFFIWNNNSNQDIAVDLELNGLDAYINYNKGTDVLTGTLLPSTDYSGGISTEIELWKNISAEDRTIYGHIYLDITTIGTNLSNEEALKWAITSNGEVLNTGNFIGQTEGSYVALDINIPLSTTKQLFQIYIWLDESMEINDQIEGETLSTKVRAEATEVVYPEVGVKYISSLIYYGNEMINNDDPDGNIRYMGKDPDNYVLFNNELWRIIGMFDVKSSLDGPYEKRLKIIRNESIGTYSWDSSESSIYGGCGINDWTQSDLMKLLNNGGYWNKTEDLCFNDKNNATVECDFSDIGVLNEYKNFISDTLWNLGFCDGENLKTDDMYNCERSNKNFVDRPVYWIGKIGLLYASDYGYATSGGNKSERNICVNTSLFDWNNNSNCYNNNYLNKTMDYWSLNPRINYTSHSFVITNYNVSINNNALPKGVFPTLYLKSSVQITGGSGTSANPYILSINN